MAQASTKIEGIHYLLNKSTDNGFEWVSRYEAAEYRAIFTDDQRDALLQGLTITSGTGRQAFTVTDMVAATRAIAHR